ncbi:PF20097 family protein [Isosphaeraceae bacterium EP7]
MPQPHCPKCSQPMDDGFLIDHSYGRDTQAEWIGGTPEPSTWWTGVLKLKGKVRRPVTTFCCPKCGFLESYAKLAAE